MIAHARSVGKALTVFGVTGVLLSAGMYAALLCTSGTLTCLSASVGFAVESFNPPLPSFEQAVTTSSQISDQPLVPFLSVQAIQLIALTTLVLGVVLLIILEFFELYYLRRLRQKFG